MYLTDFLCNKPFFFKKKGHTDVEYICVRICNEVKDAGILSGTPCFTAGQLQTFRRKVLFPSSESRKEKKKRSIFLDQLIRNESRPAKEHTKGAERRQLCRD